MGELSDRMVAAGFERREGRAFSSGDLTAPVGAEFVRRAPARAPAMGADVGVNLSFSLGSALLVWLLAALLALVSWRIDVLLWGLVAGAAVALLVWFGLMFETLRRLWTVEEARPGRDRDELGVRRHLNLQMREGNRLRLGMIETLYEDQVEAVAEILAAGSTFNRRAMCPAAFPAELYSDVRSEMLELGLFETVGDANNARLEITSWGRELFGRYSPTLLE